MNFILVWGSTEYIILVRGQEDNIAVILMSLIFVDVNMTTLNCKDLFNRGYRLNMIEE